MCEYLYYHSQTVIIADDCRSWLFAASLVLGVGLLGGFNRILEKYTRMSIQAMDHLAQNDAHARQYSLIAQSLLTTALEHLERQDLQDRMRRTENSSHLFGLVAPDARSPLNKSPAPMRDGNIGLQANTTARAAVLQSQSLAPSPRMGEMDSMFLGLSEPMLHTPDTTYWDGIVGNDDDPNSALNLFPLLETGRDRFGALAVSLVYIILEGDLYMVLLNCHHMKREAMR